MSEDYGGKKQVALVVLHVMWTANTGKYTAICWNPLLWNKKPQSYSALKQSIVENKKMLYDQFNLHIFKRKPTKKIW